MTQSAATGHDSLRGARFAVTKFRSPALPGTLIARSALHDRLAEGAGKRLTVVVGSAGAGKSVLLADWAAARPPGLTSWLSCDRSDADPLRFWAGFIEAPRAIEPGFGADAANLLAMDRRMSADVTASVANDAARLPAGSAVIDQAGKIPAESGLAVRHAAFQSFRYGVAGQLEKSVRTALAARAIQQQTQLSDEWNAVVPLVLIRVYTCLEDFPAAEGEAAAVLAAPDVAESVRLVMVPGARALAWLEAGRLAEAADAAGAADAEAQRLGFGQHFFAVDYLRVLSGLALERRDLDTAEHLTERVLSITEQRRPLFEFLALLDRAQIWAARGLVRDALTTVGAARQVVAGSSPALLARADEQEALLRLSLGDLRAPAELASGLPAARRSLLLAKVALAAGNHHAMQQHVQPTAPGDLTPRRALVRQLLLAATAIERGDRTAANMLGGALHLARSQGFLNTVITTAPQVTRYLVEHAARLRSDPFTDHLVAAALEVRASQPGTAPPSQVLTEPLTAAEQRILALLPTSTYLQIADTLYISRNTVKTHLRSIYQKLGVSSRSGALERAVDLRLL
jgi:ATP/maltotriose-dependent transcriptional regulator MalT